MTNIVEATVQDYYRIVGDLTSPETDLLDLMAPDAVLIEHPNPIAPQGATRTPEQTLAGLRAGRALLSKQTIVVQKFW